MNHQLLTVYFGVRIYSHTATTLKIIFGVHAASAGGMCPFTENVTANLSITTKSAAVTIPNARCKPLPPRTFREATIAPIIVMMITENGVESQIGRASCRERV